MVDITDETRPVPISTYAPAASATVAPGNQYGAHQPAEQVVDNKMFVTWFSGGLRVVRYQQSIPARRNRLLRA